MTFSPAAFDVVRKRKTKVQSWYLDLSMIAAYGGESRVYHHTAPINALYGLHEALVVLEEEGIEQSWERHRANHMALRAGIEAKAARGELKVLLPPGYVYDAEDRIVLDPDERVQQAIRSMFEQFEHHTSIRQLALSYLESQTLFPVRRPRSRDQPCRFRLRQPQMPAATANQAATRPAASQSCPRLRMSFLRPGDVADYASGWPARGQAAACRTAWRCAALRMPRCPVSRR